MVHGTVARRAGLRWYPVFDWLRTAWRPRRQAFDRYGAMVRRAAGVVRAGNDEPPPDPLTVRQWIYGPGCVIPGDHEYLVDLVKVFGLGPEMTMLELGSGMGGSAAVIAQGFNTYIEGLESNPGLIHAASTFLPTQKSAKRVRLTQYDPEKFELRSGFYYRILAREATYCVADKQRVFAMASQGLRRLGHIIVTDFVRDDSVAPGPEFAGWAAMQPDKPQLWTARQYIECLQSLGFDVQATSDATNDYRKLILRSWRHALERPELKQLRGRRARPLIDEAERAIRTLAALESGALKFHYIFALQGNSKPPA
jgi:SAM-dependent methyltransferase